MARRLTAEESKVWTLHTAGFCLSQIAALAGIPESRTRSIVTGRWLDDKQEARRGRK